MRRTLRVYLGGVQLCGTVDARRRERGVAVEVTRRVAAARWRRADTGNGGKVSGSDEEDNERGRTGCEECCESVQGRVSDNRQRAEKTAPFHLPRRAAPRSDLLFLASPSLRFLLSLSRCSCGVFCRRGSYWTAEGNTVRDEEKEASSSFFVVFSSQTTRQLSLNCFTCSPL
jgi:hypothetical protein